jgi:hypothetical protein
VCSGRFAEPVMGEIHPVWVGGKGEDRWAVGARRGDIESPAKSGSPSSSAGAVRGGNFNPCPQSVHGRGNSGPPTHGLELDVQPIGQTGEALASRREHLGQTQQVGIITTVACFAAGAATFLGTRYGICEHGGGPGAAGDRRRAQCNDIGSWGGLGLGFVCGFSALFPFQGAMNGRHIRSVIIGLCYAMLVLPAMRYYRTPPEWTVMGVLRTTFPAWLILFGMLCLDEGRARGRRERADREKQSPPP